jgi:hypothetical protein
MDSKRHNLFFARVQGQDSGWIAVALACALL